MKGLLTPIDVLEAIAGEFPDEDEQLTIQQLDTGPWKADGAVDLYSLEQTLGVDSLIDDKEYVSLAKFLGNPVVYDANNLFNMDTNHSCNNIHCSNDHVNTPIKVEKILVSHFPGWFFIFCY